eukprot:TRINITY_DN404_c0_g1_i3.p1 TRINITY_DN404_c0_g1~~TRINITY_DN404_c0_g1_i3.p1  ORF type:complete len:256 (-),score=97.75 TRINITY_DN404_c0_g1_i3:219-986(-)
MQIKGKTFVVTGAGSGLGEATVRRIVEEGGNVIALDMAEQGKKLQEEFPDKVAFAKTNVCDENSVQSALESGVAKFGGLHGVVQCAGVGNPRRVLSAKGEIHSLKDFDMIVRINLIGTFNVLRLATAMMARQEPSEGGERGVIINVASVAAFEGQIGQAAYSASKGGVAAMTLPIARELAGLGIRVLTIAPGLFNTPMLAKLPEKAKKSLSRQVPFPARLGEPAEFADLAAFIIKNQYMNAEIIRVDGGIRMAAM